MNSKTIIRIAILVLFLSACKKPIDPSDVPYTYVYTDSIVNPPDYFQVYFNINSSAQRTAEVTFGEAAVWTIEKIGDPRLTLFFGNLNDELLITAIDTLGLEGGKKYQIIVRNVYMSDNVNFFVVFKKLDLDYNSFPKKF